jgi:putative transposase
MSHINIVVHAVWGTKSRTQIISDPVRIQLCDHIKYNAKKKSIFIDTINGHTDHMHSLMHLRSDLNIGDQMQLIKGESSHWLNGAGLLPNRFEWGDEYFAESVSPKEMHAVRAYIRNQQEHHKKISFEEEYNNFIKGVNLGC